MLVPRGGKSLIERISREARVPVIAIWTEFAMSTLTNSIRKRRSGGRLQRQDAALWRIHRCLRMPAAPGSGAAGITKAGKGSGRYSSDAFKWYFK